MKLKLAIPVLGALALMAAVPSTAEARGRSSFDISVGFGYSNYNGYRGSYYNSGLSYGYGRGHHSSHYHRPLYRPSHYYSPRYYSPRPVYREYYRPVYRHYHRPVYRGYYYDRYCD